MFCDFYLVFSLRFRLVWFSWALFSIAIRVKGEMVYILEYVSVTINITAQRMQYCRRNLSNLVVSVGAAAAAAAAAIAPMLATWCGIIGTGAVERGGAEARGTVRGTARGGGGGGGAGITATGAGGMATTGAALPVRCHRRGMNLL